MCVGGGGWGRSRGGIGCARDGMSSGWRENFLKTVAEVKSLGVKYGNF